MAKWLFAETDQGHFRAGGHKRGLIQTGDRHGRCSADWALAGCRMNRTVLDQASCIKAAGRWPTTNRLQPGGVILVYDVGTTSRRIFGPSGNAADRQWRVPQHHPHGSRFSHHRVAGRTSTRRGHHCFAGGSKRASLDRTPARRPSSWPEARPDFKGVIDTQQGGLRPMAAALRVAQSLLPFGPGQVAPEGDR